MHPETTYHQGKPSQVIINSFKSGAFTKSLNKQAKHLQPFKRQTKVTLKDDFIIIQILYVSVLILLTTCLISRACQTYMYSAIPGEVVYNITTIYESVRLTKFIQCT